jgi:hypothetical protein
MPLLPPSAARKTPRGSQGLLRSTADPLHQQPWLDSHAVGTKATGETIKSQPKDTHQKDGFSSDSIKGRTLSLLNSKPTEIFTTKAAAEALEVKHEPSVRAALCALFADRLIAKPDTGKYQSLNVRWGVTARSDPTANGQP